MTIMPMKPGTGTIEEILAMPALPGMQAPTTPFVWGQGGARLTPEQLAGQRALAQGQAQSDYSPVQHWTQGLGRVLDNFTGSQDLKRLDREEGRMNEDRLAQITAMAGEANADLAPGLASADPVVQALAGKQLLARTPKQNEATPLQRNYEWLLSQGRTTEANNLISKDTDPTRWNPFVDPATGQLGWMPIRPEGPVMGNMRGGGQASSAAPDWLSSFTPEELAVMQGEASRRAGSNVPRGNPTTPPATLPADFDFGGR